MCLNVDLTVSFLAEKFLAALPCHQKVLAREIQPDDLGLTRTHVECRVSAVYETVACHVAHVYPGWAVHRAVRQEIRAGSQFLI